MTLLSFELRTLDKSLKDLRESSRNDGILWEGEKYRHGDEQIDDPRDEVLEFALERRFVELGEKEYLGDECLEEIILVELFN